MANATSNPMISLAQVGVPRRGRKLRERFFLGVCITATLLSVLVLGVLLASIVRDGWKHLDWGFINSFPSRKPELSGIKSALWGSVWLVCVAASFAIPLGVATAIALEEYKPRRRISRWLHSFIQINIGNLAGVPSIVYGVIGLTVFARMFGVFGGTNPSIIYDAMSVLTLNSGQVVQACIIDENETSLDVVIPDQGSQRIALADVRSRRDIYVRQHHVILNDGREAKGLFKEVTPEKIIFKITGDADPADTHRVEEQPTVREFEFSPREVKRYRTKNYIQLGNSDGFFYFQLPFGPSVISGGLTLGLVILPVVIIASREALRAVPNSLREGALALGCTRWQTIRRIVLPSSVPGIMTGAILSMSRAIGEAAPLLMAGAFLFILQTPRNLLDSFAALPLQIFNWAGKPQDEFHSLAASGIVVLLIVLVAFNTVAIVIRQMFAKKE